MKLSTKIFNCSICSFSLDGSDNLLNFFCLFHIIAPFRVAILFIFAILSNRILVVNELPLSTVPPRGFEPLFIDPQSIVLSTERRGLILIPHPFCGGGGTRTHRPLAGQRLAISCNNHYTTPPIFCLIPFKIHQVNLILI